MAFTYTGSTTFSEAVSADANEFTVASTTGLTVDMLLVTFGEIMHVREIPVSGRVKVRRGIEGTTAGPHNSGERVYFGDASSYARLRDYSARLFGTASRVPDICIPGVRGVDVRGYEYILLDSTATIVPGATVLISKDGNYTASVLTSGGAGNVGILMENATSDQWAWAMIRGYHEHAKLTGGSSLMTSTGLLRASTEVSTPAVGLRGATTSGTTGTSVLIGATGGEVYRMWPASAYSSASTSATSETGAYCAVWMDYPFVQRRISS